MSAMTHDPSLVSGIDPELDRLIEELTRRVQAGESVDLEAFAREHPGYTEPLRRLLPALELLADLGQSVSAENPRGRMAGPDPIAGLGELGDFRLVREIGRGGMGIVYEAEQISLRRRVALKVLPFAAGLDARQIQRFRVEAQAAACLHHPHIVPVHGVGCDRGVHYYAMQLIEGQSLAAMIAELRRLDGLDPPDGTAPGLDGVSTSDLAARLISGGAADRPAGAGSNAPTVELPAGIPHPEAPATRASQSGPGHLATSGSSIRNRDYIRGAARLALQAAEALDHAHDRGILHRDIKPANLLLDAEGRLWVTDFGLAQVRGDDRLTLSGDVLGTLRYMSPEQALGRRVVIDGRTDVYSLGVTLYELLTLRPADGRDRAEILRRIAEQEAAPPRRLNPAVPADLETIVAKAMDKEAASRYATAQELAADLRNFLEDRPIRARRPTLAGRARRWGRRHQTLAWSAATTVLVAALMLAGGIGYVTRDRAARLAQTGQRVAEALAGARTAIEAGDLALARQRVAEARGHLAPERDRLPQVAADIDRIRHEIEARQADAARFSQFLKGTSDAQDKMSYGRDLGGERVAEETLGLYGVLTEKDWSSRVEGFYLTADQKQQVRETAYVTLVSLADFGVRWLVSREDPRPVTRSLDLLQRAQSFHQPTRAFYFVRAECRRRQGNTTGADEDEKQFRAATARTAWDYYLPGHTAGWRGDLDEAIRSYQAALRLQPNHFNSLYFLASRLSSDKINRRPEAIAYFTGCIALRPDHGWPYVNRGECRMKLGQMDAANADFEAGLALCTTDIDRCAALRNLAEVMLEKDQRQEPQELFARVLELARRVRWEEFTATLAATEALASPYANRHQYSKAEPLWVQELEIFRHVLGEEREETLITMVNLAWVYREQGKSAQAEPLVVRALEVQRRVLGEEHPDTLQTMAKLGSLYRDQGKSAQAEPLVVRALEVQRRVLGEGHPDMLISMDNLAELYWKQGKYAEAEPLLRECLKIRERIAPDNWTTFNTRSQLGGSLLGQEKYAEAEPMLKAGYEGMKQREATIPPRGKVRLTEAIERLVQLYEATGEPGKAACWRARLSRTDLPADVFARP